VSAFFAALLGLFKYYLQIENIQLPISTPYGTSFNSDKNFFALFSMLGIIGLTTQLIKSDTVKSNIMSQLVLLVLTLNILFANSFRSILLLVILLLLLLITQFFYKHRKIAVLSKRVRFFTAVYLFVVVGFVYGFKSGNQNIIRYVDIYWNDISNGGEISTDNISNKVFNLDKWNYALELYKNQSIIEKVFGGGFDYLDKFGLEYNKTTEQIEYPHNPILSGLLYSGMVGGILIMFFMLVSLYYGGKYLVRYPLFALMLFTSMLFVLFSGNSLFSVPIFLFLFSISFLIRYQEISEMINIVNIDKPGAKFIKDLFDYVLASIMLVLLLPVLIVITIVIGLTMGWPIVFSQIRIGQNANPFRLHKFRSMKKIKNKSTTVAAVEQNRVTAFGRFLRRYKLDELPELWNIIRGDMSFVGPRPDVVGYADKLKADDRVILQLKPGLTGAASLKYMHEEDVLQKQKDPQKYNDEIIFPDKVIVNKKYMKNWSLLLDLKIIIFTAMGKSMHEDEFL
jgi:lipopolysaccharide/colanic/teichoic acid biosynthesis glycosyltransferase